MKRPLAGVESVKTRPKTSEVQFTVTPFEGSPFGGVRFGRGAPRQHAMPEPLGQGQASVGAPAHVRGCFCEVAECESVLAVKMRESGTAIHALSGRANTHVEPFDELKVAMKRGEIDWLHIVPEFCWCDHDRVITRVVTISGLDQC